MQRGKYFEVARLNDCDTRITRPTRFVIAISLGITLFIIYRSMDNMGALIFNTVFLLGIAVLIHELIHFTLLWFFSKKMPNIGFIYVILRSKAHISRNEGFLSYLLPFFVITLVISIMWFFVNPTFQTTLLIVGIIHFSVCSSDFAYSFQLLKHRNINVKLTYGRSSRRFDTIIFSS